MIKTLAALFMLIDHVGAILYPQVYSLRIIGRLSMPLFAYCIARGFYFSEQNGTTQKYVRNLFLFAVVSQIPFGAKENSILPLNIGFTWLFALCLMKSSQVEKKRLYGALMSVSVVIIALAVPVEYGLYGMLYPSVFYLCLFRRNSPQIAFAGMYALYVLYILMGGGAIQVFSLIAFPVLLIARRYDNKIELPRRFFYWFYPVHIVVLLVLKGAFF